MDVNAQEKVCTVSISLIDDFAEHPFQVRDDEDMKRLVQSINNNGVLTPVILRKKVRISMCPSFSEKKRLIPIPTGGATVCEVTFRPTPKWRGVSF